MRIAVCVKQVIDVRFPFEVDPDSCTPLEDDVFYSVNPADECAVEIALKIKEREGGEVILISYGPQRVEEALRSCLAKGGDKVIHILDSNVEANSVGAAHILAKALASLSPDLILCGSKSSDEGCAEFPAALAELLHLPQATGVVKLELDRHEEKAIVQRKLEKGRRESLECPIPAVLAVEPGIEQPRYASLPQLMDAYEAHIMQMGYEQLKPDISQIESHFHRRLVGLSLPRPRPKKIFTIDSSLSAEQRMDLLMSGGLFQRQSASELWEGEPEELATRLVEVLRAQEKVWA